VVAGESELYAVLVRRHQPAVFRVAAAMLGNPAAADAVVQQAFVSAYEHLDQYRPDLPFAPWVKTIARNVARKEALRADSERRRIGLYRDFVIAATEDTRETDDHDELVDAALSACRAELAPAAAQALALRYGEGRPLDEIAPVLGRSVVATRQLLFRVRLALRDCLLRRLARA
jgi:RNA polymerase sigma-70 factor (ECF subfamily)